MVLSATFLRGLLPTNLPLFSCLLQLPISFSIDFRLTAREHVTRRYVANDRSSGHCCNVQRCPSLSRLASSRDSGVPGRMHSPFSDLCQRSYRAGPRFRQSSPMSFFLPRHAPPSAQPPRRRGSAVLSARRQRPVLEELLLAAVEDRGLQTQLIAQLRDGLLVQQMPPQNGDPEQRQLQLCLRADREHHAV
jgi:hypothetical protein